LADCPECVARERKKQREAYQIEVEKAKEAGTEIEIRREGNFEETIEFPMKFDPATKHFICKRCGLYATREQIHDIRDKLNSREFTREDKQYDYLEWWQKSKKDK